MPVGESFLRHIEDPRSVQSHTWLPLLRYIKRIKRYRPQENKTRFKSRMICYASHRDAAILSLYSYKITELLEAEYGRRGLTDNVIGYRKLGRSNYDFAAQARAFALDIAPCKVMAFDVTGFFDNLDHKLLKAKLKMLLDVKELPGDWYSVFKAVTKFRHIELANIREHEAFLDRINSPSYRLIGTIKEMKAAGINIGLHEDRFGVPQGTPISACLSNLYMLDIDKEMQLACFNSNALYQRYSDDILVISPHEHAEMLKDRLGDLLSNVSLSLNDDKSEISDFDPAATQSFQYLGFDMSPSGATIRASSLARQWRKMRRAVRITGEDGRAAIEAGYAESVFTKKLRKRFSPIGVRNFSSYARRAAKALGSKGVLRQIKRFEREADQAIRNLNASRPKRQR